MTQLMITCVYHADEPRSSLRFNLGRDDRLIDEIARYAGLKIPIVEGKLCDVAPPEGFILWNAHGLDPADGLRECLERSGELGSRLVAIDASPSRVFRGLEHLNLAALVDPLSHLRWKDPERAPNSREGIYGRRDIAARIGATCEEDGSEHYAYLTSPTHEGLPHLIADYLATLHQN